MTTQHLYSRTLVGLVLLGGLVAFSGGGCAKSVATGHQALPYTQADEHPAEVQGLTDEGGGAVTVSDEPRSDPGEAGRYMGYEDPVSHGTPLSVTEESGTGLVHHDDATYQETPCTPPGSDSEGTLEQNGNRDEGSFEKETLSVGTNSDESSTAGTNEGTITSENEPEGTHYEGDLPSAPDEIESGESGTDSNLDSP